MKTLDLLFKGYYRESKKKGIAAVSGVYCVYSCIYNIDIDKVTLKKLLYIGESENIHDRIANHEKLGDWKKHLLNGQMLCYSYAEIDSEDRERAEAALIFKTQPPCNVEHKNEYIYEDTKINTLGKNKFLPDSFVVKKGEAIKK